MTGDHEIGTPEEVERNEDARVRSGAGSAYREIGELLLQVDELEDTLRAMEARPRVRGEEVGASPGDAMRRLEQRLRTGRARIEALERRGTIPYREVERAMRVADAPD